METYDPHKSTTEVRGGSRGTTNLRILIIAFFAIIILFAIIYFIYSAGSSGQATI